jgi:4-hydroxybenzoate polyprenyltransferase/phosphoserine phosphatase
LENELYNNIKPEIIPLCVDLDGTLINTDTLTESLLIALKKNPLIFFLLPFWLIKGRDFLKSKVAEYGIPDPAFLPYRQDVLDFINEQKQSGREIVLATATIQSIADSLEDHLHIFDRVIGTEVGNNLRSESKRATLVKLFGEKGYDYIGNSTSDVAVWKSANSALIVNPSKSLLKSAQKVANVSKVFSDKKNILKLFIKEIRVYQWFKNVLIFLPFLLAHQISNPENFTKAILAFLAFSFCASHVYVLNDLLDIESDRHHPRKKKRPIASGSLSIVAGIIIAPILLLAGAFISIFFLPLSFTITMFIYLFLTASYSFFLKRVIILDVIILSILYTLRLLAGAYATSVFASPWLLGFSIFVFLSLAIVKRYTELSVLLESNKSETKGRSYIVDDLSLLGTLGPSAGYMSVMVLALYVNSKEVANLYTHPEILWLVVLCHLYWISRIWLFAHRGKMDDDPLVFSLKDRVSYVIGFILILLVVGATL